jgi:hypothetical protein
MILLDDFPLWAVYVGIVIAVLVAAEIGFRLGIWLQRRDPDSGKTPMVADRLRAVLCFPISQER